MIVECYSADVYCDHRDHEYRTTGDIGSPVTLTGRNKKETDRQRRKAGWIKRYDRDICPACRKLESIAIADLMR
jgi:hypothetical protein